MNEAPRPNPYSVPLDELERTAQVPLRDQVSSMAAPPPPDPVPQDERERQRLLQVAGDGA